MLKRLFFTIIFILTISFQAYGQESEKQTASQPGTENAAAGARSADGVKIHYTNYGSADRALVLVHGWSCDESYWDKQVEGFKDDYRIVTIDLAGHGESGIEREDWTIQAYGRDVAAVVNHLDLSEVILIGHSMGGPVCIEAARNLPQKTAALIGVDTYQDLTRKMTEQQVDMFMAPFRQNFALQVKNFVKLMFPEHGDTVLATWVADDMAEADPLIAMSSMRNLFLYDTEKALKEMRKPIRAINTDMFPTNLQGNQEVTESFELKIMPGQGHFLHMENPEEFNKLLAETIHEFWPASNE
ncbi:MAG: alpha/beta fold hydrolase [candidate division Zixibacteria bacterium]|nr:alpha/beta fold hydrolase [candidate division Zixibacteria bacterium]